MIDNTEWLRSVCPTIVTGLVEEYTGRPQIVIGLPVQVKVIARIPGRTVRSSYRRRAWPPEFVFLTLAHGRDTLLLRGGEFILRPEPATST